MNTAIIKPEDLQLDLVTWQGFSIQAERIASSIEITCDEEEGMAVDSLSQIKTFMKQTEEARKNEVDPFNRLVKRVNDMFRPIGESLENAEKAIKEKVKFYRIEKERIRQEAERKRQEEYERKVEEERKKAEATGKEQKIVTPPPTVLPVAQTTHGSIGSATAKEFWNYEVMDIQALYAVRPDLVKMEVKARETKAACQISQTIPGLRIFEDMEIAAR